MEYLALSTDTQVAFYESYYKSYTASYHIVKKIRETTSIIFTIACDIYRVSTDLLKGPETGYEGEPIPLTAIRKTQEQEFYTKLY